MKVVLFGGESDVSSIFRNAEGSLCKTYKAQGMSATLGPLKVKAIPFSPPAQATHPIPSPSVSLHSLLVTARLSLTSMIILHLELEQPIERIGRVVRQGVDAGFGKSGEFEGRETGRGGIGGGEGEGGRESGEEEGGGAGEHVVCLGLGSCGGLVYVVEDID